MENVKVLLERLRAWSCFSSREDVHDATMDTTAIHAINKNPSSTSSSLGVDEPSTSVVLSHGAFQTLYHYQAYVDAIRTKTRIDRIVVPEQLSAGPAPPANCFEKDVSNIQSAIAEELRSGRDVLLLAHSYGGIPGCEALAGLPTSPAENDGMPVGRILGIVFVTAFVAERGQSLMASYHKRADWVRIDDTGLCHVERPGPTLYSSTRPQRLVSELVERLVPQAASSFAAETKHMTWQRFPCYYVRCTEDRAMLVEQQDFFIARLWRLAGKGVIVKDLPSDHAPFACLPERLADLTEEIVSELHLQKMSG